MLGLLSFTALMLFMKLTVNSLSFSDDAVKTSSGSIRGTEVVIRGNTVKQYLGVPYAQPPVGDLRFKKPQPVESWSDVYEADSMPPACVQYVAYPFPWYDFEDGKSEDCLYMNIWVPKDLLVEIGIKKLPVMFWLYGGGFTVGSNRKVLYEGQALADEGKIIVVTINYRMTVFGFLTSGTDDAPGNVGVYDMVEALKWVNENIAAFGGDPDQVTIAGQSSGSIAVGLLCVSPLTRGLYKRVIMESGSPFYLFAENNTENIARSEKLAEAVGCADDETTIYDNPEEVVSCLREKDAFELAKTFASFSPTSARSFFPNYGDDVLPVNARKALMDGDFQDANVLIGNNRDEGSFQITTGNPDLFGFFGEKDPAINKSQGTSMIKSTFSSFPDPDDVAAYYLDDLDEDDTDLVRYQVYTASGDYSLLCPTVYFAESYSKQGNNVYFYFFTHRPSTTPWAPWMGVAHLEEIQFVFGKPLQAPSNYTTKEFFLSKRMINIWSNFVKTGSPGLIYNWPLYSREKPVYLELDTSLRIRSGKGPHKDNCDFLRKYFFD